MANQGWQLTVGDTSVAVAQDTAEKCAQFMLAAGFPQFCQRWVIEEAKPVWVPREAGMYHWIDLDLPPQR